MTTVIWVEIDFDRVLIWAEKKDWSCSGMRSLVTVQRRAMAAAVEAAVEMAAVVGAKLMFS